MYMHDEVNQFSINCSKLKPGTECVTGKASKGIGDVQGKCESPSTRSRRAVRPFRLESSTSNYATNSCTVRTGTLNGILN